MTRQEKYPETQTFKFLNENPKGRLTGDCAIRALTTATGYSYESVLWELTRLSLQTGYATTSVQNIDKYLKNHGWTKHKQPRKPDNKKFTGKEWCEFMELWFADYAMVANIGGSHVVAIKEATCKNGAERYKIHDTWNSTGGCIGNFWTLGKYGDYDYEEAYALWR